MNEGINSFVDTINQLEKENENLKFRLSLVSGSLPLAVEFGYKQCEKGNNLEMALIEFNKLNGTDR